MSTTTDTTMSRPQAWIGCLACYNAGRLVGDWFDGSEAGSVEASGLQSLAFEDERERAEHLTHEELWVFDHEGYGGLLQGECSPMEAQRLAEQLETICEADRAAYAAYVGAGYDAGSFEDAYQGEWGSFEEFAYDLAERVDLLHGVPEHVATYFDYDAWARDLLLGGDYFTIDAPGSPGDRVWVFDGRA